MEQRKNIFPKKHVKIDLWLVAILVLAAFLYGWNIWEAGSANSFYTSAIISMSESWKNFWYASFDPAGFITVDKPPVALWFMVIFVKIFGLHGWSIVISSVLFSLGSVFLIYKMVKPYFGALAARIAALLMTLTPIVVADARTNNMDATLVFFLLLACYVLQKAVSKHNIWLVGLAFALVGVSFNVKMLQAFMILPAMYVFYWIASKENWKRILWGSVVGTIALIVFTLSWPLAVDSVSKQNRPYIGSSSTNSVLNLAFGYNGTQRLLGQTTGTGGTFTGMGNSKKGTKTKAKAKAPNTKKLTNSNKQNKAGGKAPGMTKGTGKTGNNAGGGNSIFNVGTAGVTRLFQTALGQQISWYLPLALVGLIIAYLAAYDTKKKWWQLNRRQEQLIYWAGWLVPVAGFFSVASFFHPYYTIMLAPPIAVLAAVGISSFIESLNTVPSKKNYWLRGIMGVGIITNGALQAFFVWEYSVIAGIVVAVISVIMSIFIIFNYSKVKLFTAVGLLGLLWLPAFWSLTPTISAESAAIPTSGPSLLSGNGQSAGSIGDNSANTKLISYLKKHNGSKVKYLFATTDSNTAAPYIIKTKKAVMTIGGYNGTDNAITLKQFKKLVKKGEIKYFYISSHTNNNAIVRWVKKHGKKISASTYGGNSSSTTPSGMSKKGSRGPQQSAKGGPGGKKNMANFQGKKPKKMGKMGKMVKNKKNKKSNIAGKMSGGMGQQQSSVLYELD
ncbi:glycosyltransferase family 39 protein [Liquorilactobacillus hordei]|uniref:ArnT family glycosyltransferase n=1 Tax=Liquorilactobacillus hordei TaxID=468911 RepID=UPI0039ED356C